MDEDTVSDKVGSLNIPLLVCSCISQHFLECEIRREILTYNDTVVTRWWDTERDKDGVHCCEESSSIRSHFFGYSYLASHVWMSAAYRRPGVACDSVCVFMKPVSHSCDCPSVPCWMFLNDVEGKLRHMNIQSLWCLWGHICSNQTTFLSPPCFLFVCETCWGLDYV